MRNPKSSKYCSAFQWLVSLLALTVSLGVLAQSSTQPCGDLRSGYGPFDYRTTRGDKLEIVERYHFTPEVEGLIRGKSSMHIGQDLSYTLGTFPNHHRALMSVMLYGKKLKSPQPPHTSYSIDCFFLRAIRFRPDDTTVRMMYATYLKDNARGPEAIKALEQVEKAAGDDPFIYYNLGLIFMDMKEYEKSLAYAHKATSLGFVQTGLRDKLMALGKWRDPVETQESSMQVSH